MDWVKLLKDLDEAGYTQTKIASYCGVAQSTVSALSRGVTADTSFQIGAKLIALHAAVMSGRKPVAA